MQTDFQNKMMPTGSLATKTESKSDSWSFVVIYVAPEFQAIVLIYFLIIWLQKLQNH